MQQPKPRVSLFLPSLEGGGAERVMLTLAGEIARRGYPTDFVLSQAWGPLLAEMPSNVNQIDLNGPRVIASLPALVRYLRRYRPHAMVSGLNHANVVVLWARLLARVPTRTVVTAHNSLSLTTKGGSFAERAIPFLIGTCYGLADAIVAVSQGVADDLAETAGLPRESIQVIYNPVVTDELYARGRKTVDDPWFAEGAVPVILAVGSLRRQKDFPTLIRAFAQIAGRCRARLMILGEGPERGSLEALVRDLGLEERVSLPGFVSDVLARMSRAGMFVLSSLTEGLPTVLIEAAALGVPVVSTDCKSGPAEILDGGTYGCLVPVGDAEALAAGMLAVLESPGRYIVPAQRLEQFTPQVVVPQYLRAMGLE